MLRLIAPASSNWAVGGIGAMTMLGGVVLPLFLSASSPLPLPLISTVVSAGGHPGDSLSPLVRGGGPAAVPSRRGSRGSGGQETQGRLTTERVSEEEGGVCVCACVLVSDYLLFFILF